MPAWRWVVYPLSPSIGLYGPRIFPDAAHSWGLSFALVAVPVSVEGVGWWGYLRDW